MTTPELSALLTQRVEDVVQRHLLPNGKEYHGEWLVGSVGGEAGKSMRVRLTGDKAGLWLDFASGERGDLIKLWQVTRNLSFKETMREIRQYLGVEDEEDTARKAPSRAWEQLQREMGTGTEHDLATVAALRQLPTTAGLSLAVENGHLFFGPVFDAPEHGDGEYHHAWIATDSARRSAQARRMSGLPWADGQKAKTIHGTSGRWPVGIADSALPEIAFTEGGPDFLAAYTAVAMLGVQDRIQPVTLFGSGQKIHPDALPLFAGKRVWMFPHSDDNYAGLQGALQWERQLWAVQAHVIPFDFSAYPGVKDLNDFISALAAEPQEV